MQQPTLSSHLRSSGINEAEVRQAELLAALLHTYEFGRTLRSTALAVLDSWSEGNRVKSFFAAFLAWLVNLFFAYTEKDKTTRIRDVLKQPRHARAAVNAVAIVANRFIQAAQALQEGATTDNPDIADAGTSEPFNTAEAGRLITELLKQFNHISAEDPDLHTKQRREALADLIANLDFGELKESVDRLASNSVELSEMINAELWRYPAKMICLLAIFPTCANAAIQSVQKTLEPINKLAPDLTADVLLAFLNEIDGKSIGILANEMLELLRKIEVGQVLIGANSKPQLPEDIARLLENILQNVDMSLLLKVRSLLHETKADLSLQLLSYLETNPELAVEIVVSPLREHANSFHQIAHSLDTLENSLDDNEIASAVQQGIAALDAQQFADTINRLFSLFNRIRESHPAIARDIITETISALDPTEIKIALDGIAADTIEALKPLAPIILTPLIRVLTDFLDTPANGQSDELIKAIVDFRRRLSSAEVAA
jgi:hypothetical protein